MSEPPGKTGFKLLLTAIQGKNQLICLKLKETRNVNSFGSR